MKAVYLSLGSNVDPQLHIPKTIELLKKDFHAFKVSSIYETDPIGPAGNQKFWNLCVAIPAESYETLLPKIRALENQMGRKRSENKFAPRPIDIDILPQPDYQKLAFIMIPLAEIAAEEKDPETGKSFGELAEKLREESKKIRKIL